MKNDIQQIFNRGDFIMNKNPYNGEGEYLIVDLDYNGTEWYGYKCARMKGKYVMQHDLNNHEIIDKWHQQNYTIVG